MNAGSVTGEATWGAVPVTGTAPAPLDGGGFLSPQAVAQLLGCGDTRLFPLVVLSVFEHMEIDRFGMFGDDRG